MPTAFVSGVFDLLHSGHVAFLETAAKFGDLTVAVGSDSTVKELKGRLPVCSEAERLYQIQAIRWVKEAFISRGSGVLDFAEELCKRRPDYFVVNKDGDHPAKRELCQQLGVSYEVLERFSLSGLPARSSTALRSHFVIPHRLELAGGWLDQPAVSSLSRGSVVVASVQLQTGAEERSGLAGSTRETAMSLWGNVLPEGDSITQARFLFGAENPPGTEMISGSQDALGILLPGVNRLDYAGKFWPEHIYSLGNEETYDWLERHIALVPLGPRPASLDVASTQGITATNARRLAEGSAEFLEGVERRDLDRIGRSFSKMLAAQAAMFPAMLPDTIRPVMRQLATNSLGVKFTGAGGGGYLLVATSVSIPGAVPYRIRRPSALQD